MKNVFIFFAILIIGLIAFIDAKDRFSELDEISANTPSQVEMKQMINKQDAKLNRDDIQNRNSIQTLKQKSNSDGAKQNQLNNVDRMRDTIDNQIP